MSSQRVLELQDPRLRDAYAFVADGVEAFIEELDAGSGSLQDWVDDMLHVEEIDDDWDDVLVKRPRCSAIVTLLLELGLDSDNVEVVMVDENRRKARVLLMPTKPDGPFAACVVETKWNDVAPTAKGLTDLADRHFLAADQVLCSAVVPANRV